MAVLAFAATSATSATKVTVGNNFFKPKTVTIKKGGSVKWVWAGGIPHNVKGPGFKSKTTATKGFTYTHRFTKKGTYNVLCQVHPSQMKMKVKVT
jgi:plastocyanin